MRFADHLKEEYGFRYGNAEVFKNPTTDDLRAISKEIHRSATPMVRVCMVPSTKNVYIWNSYHDFFHWKLADTKFTDVTRTNSLFAYGTIKGNKVELSNLRCGDDDNTEFTPEEIKWMKSYKLFKWEEDIEHHGPWPKFEAYLGRSSSDRMVFKGGGLVKASTNYDEVFINPTPKEMNTFKDVRFIADNKTKNFFVSSLIFFHEAFVEYLAKEGHLRSTRDCFMGAGEIKNGKIQFENYSEDFELSGGGPQFQWATHYFTPASAQWVVMPEKGSQFESYVMTLKGKTSAVKEFPAPVFMNPNKDEMRELGTDIRFIIDFDNKDVYVWSGYALLHDKVIKELETQENIKLYNIALGHSTSRSGKMRIFDFVFRTKNRARIEAARDLDWLKVYFDNIENQWTDMARIKNEEYVGTKQANVYGTDVKTIFSNPSRKEIIELSRENDHCRFIINFTTKDLFVFDASLIHVEAADELRELDLIPTKMIYTDKFRRECYPGIGKWVNGKIEYKSCYEGNYASEFDFAPWAKEKQDWLNRFFTEPFMDAAGFTSRTGLRGKKK